ncbi:MAG: hypothetical protein H6500_00620 [Candidatus Woesearchaeota archaeon]|nr:MAG: hypothetical protein H6500_00620 [Candidatus Woesearchaeota archaeon]
MVKINSKKIGIIVGSILLMILVVYVILHPAWITHPKYMMDKQYCEQDSDCFQFATCEPINVYQTNYEQKGICKIVTCGVSNCINNKCSINNSCVGEK